MLREQEFIIHMYIDGAPITHFLSFHLSQSFNSHHFFELRMEHGKLGLPGLINMEDTRDFVGRKLVVSFGYDEVKLQNFRGIITSVSLAQSNGFQGEIVVRGYSPTILIDRGPDLGSYLDKSLENIVKIATQDVIAGDLYMSINPSRKAALDYVIQYKESDFDFLNRLSGEYFEWFYYDGEQLCFGKPEELPQMKLTYGQEIKSLNYGINISPIKQKRFFYDSRENEMLDSESTGKAEGNADLLHALERSNEAYSKTFNQPVMPRIDSYSDLKDFVQYEEKANVSQLLKLTAESDSPEVRLGSEIQVDTSVRQDLGFVTDTLGKFLITRVEHYFDGLGRYTNNFEGVVGGTERLPVLDYKRPYPDLQLADVLKNDDPKDQGRIKVRFKWQCQSNDETEWLRVLSPDAGSSADVSTNRGFVFIPEVGDQVVVGFEEGNIARPVVMGSVFHGKSGGGGRQDNNNKNIVSKKGHGIYMDDAGSFMLQDKSKNQIITMDGKDSMEIKAAKKITIVAGKNGSSITLNSDGTIDLIGVNINIIGSANINVNAPCTGLAEGATAPCPGAKVTVGDLLSTNIESNSINYNLNTSQCIEVKSGASISHNAATSISQKSVGNQEISSNGQVIIN